MPKWCQIPKKLPRTIHSRKAYQKYLSSNVSLSPYSPCDSWFVLCWCGSWFIESLYFAFHRIWRSWFKLRTQNQDVTNASSHHPGRSTWSPFSYKSCHLQIVWSLAKQWTTEHLLCINTSTQLWEFPSEAHFFCTQSSCPERWSQCTEHQINWNARWLWQTSRYLKIS